MIVVVPRENAGELDELDFLAIQLGDDFGPPMFVNERKFFLERGFIHVVFGENINAAQERRNDGV